MYMYLYSKIVFNINSTDSTQISFFLESSHLIMWGVGWGVGVSREMVGVGEDWNSFWTKEGEAEFFFRP